jgi:hypothetical protein
VRKQVVKAWSKYTLRRQVARYQAFKRIKAKRNKQFMFICMESLVRYRDQRVSERRLVEGIRVKKV